MSLATPSAIMRRILASTEPRLEHALVFLVVASPLSIGFTNAGYVLCLLLFARDWWAGRRQFERTPLDGVILVWIATNVLAAVMSLDRIESFRDIRNLGHFGMVYLFVWAHTSEADLRRIQNAWILSGVLMALAGIYRALASLATVGEAAKGKGFFGGHLGFGHYTVVLTAVALARWTEATSRSERWLFGGATLLFGAATIASDGRGVWVTLVVVVLGWFVLSRRREVLAISAVLVCLQLGFLALGPNGIDGFYRSFRTDRVAAYLGEVSPERFYSNVWRLTMWRGGLQTFADYPATGTGIETTSLVSGSFAEVRSGFPVHHLHSNYFEILMTRGFVGLSAFFLLLLASADLLFRAFARHPPGVSRAAVFGGIAAVMAHLVHGFTYFSVGKAEIQMGFLILLGVALVPARDVLPRVSVGVSDGLRWGFLLLGFFLAWPLLERTPSVVLGLTALGLVDVLFDAACGRSRLSSAAMLSSLAFVAVSATLLLDDPTGAVTNRVISAAAAPFAFFQLGNRLFRIAGAVLSRGDRHKTKRG